MVAPIIAAVLVLFALFVAFKTVRIIPQARAGVVERLGRYQRTLGPGMAIVVHRITPGATAGVIRLDGEDWSARAYEDQRTFEPGATVQVVEIRGATAMVAD